MKIPLELPSGLYADDTSFAASGVWRSGNWVRFVDGEPEIKGGYVTANATTLTGVCRGAFAWTDHQATQNIAFGTHTNLYILKMGAVSDITPTGLEDGLADQVARYGFGEGGFGEGPFGGGPLLRTFPRTWTFDTFGQWLVGCPRGKGIYYWQNDPGTVAAAVTNAPANVFCTLVTPQRQLLALGCSEESSGDFNPMCIRGSDIQDITDWSTASDNNAFEHILEGGGEIIRGLVVGDYVAVWTDTGLHQGTYIGQPGQTFKFEQIASDCGLAAPHAVTEHNGIAYWMTPDLQFYSWYPGSLPQRIECPISDDVEDNLTRFQIAKVTAAPISQFGEIEWHFPHTGNENSSYVSLSIRETLKAQTPVWSKGTIARTSLLDSGPQQYPVGVSPSGTIYWHENGNDADGTALSWNVQSSSIYLDQAEDRVLIRGLWPDFRGQQGNVTLTIYSRDWPQSSDATETTVTITTSTTKNDFMCEGRAFAFKFSGSADPSFARFGKPLFDVKKSGKF